MQINQQENDMIASKKWVKDQLNDLMAWVDRRINGAFERYKEEQRQASADNLNRGSQAREQAEAWMRPRNGVETAAKPAERVCNCKQCHWRRNNPLAGYSDIFAVSLGLVPNSRCIEDVVKRQQETIDMLFKHLGLCVIDVPGIESHKILVGVDMGRGEQSAPAPAAKKAAPKRKARR